MALDNQVCLQAFEPRYLGEEKKKKEKKCKWQNFFQKNHVDWH